MQISQRSHATFDPFIFFSVSTIVVALLLAALFDLDALNHDLVGMRQWIVTRFSWLFVLVVTALTVFSFFLAFSKFGAIRIGKDSARPQFSTLTWLAMLFSAGMGIGLVFYGVAEPIMHYSHPPFAKPETAVAARDAMRISIFHWGLHAWGIYAVLGLALGLAHHRYGEPLAIRSTLRPLLGNKTHQMAGKVIDIVAVLATLFGLATSLGLGAAQINAGLSRLFGVNVNTNVQLMIITIITLCATLSLVTGLDRGIRRLSELNMLLALLLLLFVFIVGPTAFFMRELPDTIGSYVQTVFSMSLFTGVFRNAEWQQSWTVFYWAWWISWSPFVGTFIARVSAGRTIREFVLGVLLAPTAAGLLWFSIFGGAALHTEIFADGGIVEAVDKNTATAIFALLDVFPMAGLSSLIAIVLVAIFFITSSDSGSFVVDMLTSGGNPSPPIWQRIFWALSEGAIAGTLLLIGGLSALQAGAVSSGLPFCIILVGVSVCLWQRLKSEPAVSTR